MFAQEEEVICIYVLLYVKAYMWFNFHCQCFYLFLSVLIRMKMSVGQKLFKHFDPEKDTSIDTVQIAIKFGMDINAPQRTAAIDFCDFQKVFTKFKGN